MKNKTVQFLSGFLTLFLLLTSCGPVYVVGLTSGYNMSPHREIVSFDDKWEKEGPKRIQAINGIQMSKKIMENETSVIFQPHPGCSGFPEMSFNELDSIAIRNQFDVNVLLSDLSYNGVKKEMDSADINVYLMDFKHYRSNFVKKYSGKFYTDLLSEDNPSSELRYKNFMVFQNGSFIASADTMDEVLAMVD